MPVTSCSMLPGTDTDAFSRGVPAVAGFDSVRNWGGVATVGPQSVVEYPARTIWRFGCCVVATVMHSMRGTIRSPGSGSTATRVLVPSVYDPHDRAPRRRHRRRGRDAEVGLAGPDQRDRGLGDRRPHLADHQVQEDDPALLLLVVLELGHQEPAVLGEQDRAGVGQRQLGQGARECPDVVALHEAGADHGRDPLRLALAEDLDAADHALELGAGRSLLREGGIRERQREQAPRGRAAATSRSDPSFRRPRIATPPSWSGVRGTASIGPRGLLCQGNRNGHALRRVSRIPRSS